MIYRLYASISDSTRWIMQGYKIVRADTIDMGPLELARDGPSQMLIGRLAAGTWTFDVRGDTLRGALELPDGRVMRRVRASRIPE